MEITTVLRIKWAAFIISATLLLIGLHGMYQGEYTTGTWVSLALGGMVAAIGAVITADE